MAGEFALLDWIALSLYCILFLVSGATFIYAIAATRKCAITLNRVTIFFIPLICIPRIVFFVFRAIVDSFASAPLALFAFVPAYLIIVNYSFLLYYWLKMWQLVSQPPQQPALNAGLLGGPPSDPRAGRKSSLLLSFCRIIIAISLVLLGLFGALYIVYGFFVDYHFNPTPGLTFAELDYAMNWALIVFYLVLSLLHLVVGVAFFKAYERLVAGVPFERQQLRHKGFRSLYASCSCSVLFLLKCLFLIADTVWGPFVGVADVAFDFALVVATEVAPLSLMLFVFSRGPSVSATRAGVASMQVERASEIQQAELGPGQEEEVAEVTLDTPLHPEPEDENGFPMP
ncbi:hypothetical protein PAPYR_3610 [Paratrimastix pyriformis]|uniref:THH1/TOM1/TOM3 domain-containing protein n=1 Tax=Paratrimastix pyriformis TaxID=342808 RepID=A0ABQ8UP50_9EUKA|nr:hypothetical protein PAPYR_3610 [Paratrimastix pyriformis]